MSSSLSLIHPDIQSQVYLGGVALALSTAALPLASSEAIKIIAMSTICGFSTMLATYMMSYRGEKIEYLTVDNEKRGELFDQHRMTVRFMGGYDVELPELSVDFEKKDEQSGDRFIRSSNPFVNHFLLSIKTAGFFTLAGCVLAFAARAPLPRLTVKVDARVSIVSLLILSGTCHLMMTLLSNRLLSKLILPTPNCKFQRLS